MMHVIGLFKRVERVTKKWVKSVSTMTSRNKKECSNDLCDFVIKHFLNGDSDREISKKVLIPRDSVHYIIAKYKSTKCIETLMGRGRRRKTGTNTDHILQRKVQTTRRKSAASVKAELESKLKVIISESTVRRRLHKVGLYGRVTSKEPYVNKINRHKLLEYAKNYREKPLGFWNKVLWSDESKFNLFRSDRKVVVWRSPKGEFGPECTIPTVKYGGDNVECWACFSFSDVDSLVFIDANMTGESCREILDNYLLKSVDQLGISHDWIFQHENNPKRRAIIVANWLNRNEAERLHRSSFSPYLNPIVHLLDEAERRLKERQSKSQNELKKSYRRMAWNWVTNFKEVGWFSSESFEWCHSNTRVSNDILIMSKKRLLFFVNIFLLGWLDNFDAWKIRCTFFSFNKTGTTLDLDLKLNTRILRVTSFSKRYVGNLQWLLFLSWRRNNFFFDRWLDNFDSHCIYML